MFWKSKLILIYKCNEWGSTNKYVQMSVFIVTYPEAKHKQCHKIMFWEFEVHNAIKIQDDEEFFSLSYSKHSTISSI